MIRPDYRMFRMTTLMNQDGISSDIMHSAKGSTWKEHKYIKRVNGTYYYPNDYVGGRHLPGNKIYKNNADDKDKRLYKNNADDKDKRLYKNNADDKDKRLYKNNRELDKREFEPRTLFDNNDDFSIMEYLARQVSEITAPARQEIASKMIGNSGIRLINSMLNQNDRLANTRINLHGNLSNNPRLVNNRYIY